MTQRRHLKSWTKKDFSFDWFSGTGAGGQHRNKHQNCLRLTEVSSGITVVSQTHRDRKSNIKDALNTIAPLLVDHYYPKEGKKRAPVSEHVRTYNICENRTTDILSNNKQSFVSHDLDQDIIKRKVCILNAEEDDD